MSNEPEKVRVKKSATPFPGELLCVSRRGTYRGRPAVLAHAPAREPDHQHWDETPVLLYYADEVTNLSSRG